MQIQIEIVTTWDKKVPSFKFTRLEEEWPEVAWPSLLMRHGPPPNGVK